MHLVTRPVSSDASDKNKPLRSIQFGSQYSDEVKAAPEESQHQTFAAQRSQDFIQLENGTVFNEAVIEERDREQGIREIHQRIGEVNEISKDLAVLVHEQSYMIVLVLVLLLFLTR